MKFYTISLFDTHRNAQINRIEMSARPEEIEEYVRQAMADLDDSNEPTVHGNTVVCGQYMARITDMGYVH
jgi:hypothetical protein